MPVATATQSIIIFPVIAVGLVLAIVELVFVHADEKGLGWLSHGIHALPVMFVFIFISMNTSYFLNILGFAWLKGAWVEIAVRVVVGLIAMAKIGGAAAVAGRVGEKKFHVLIIGALVMIAPYLWEWFLADLTKQYVPFLAK